MEFKTERLVMKTDISFCNGKLVYPEEETPKSIFDIKPSTGQEHGFVFYNKNGDEVCHVGIKSVRKPCEFSYGTEEKYRGNKYMQEALNAVLSLFKTNNVNAEIMALICNNPTSEHILVKAGFIISESNKDEKWYIYKMNQDI